jgi:hypothetical protein
MFEFSEKNTKNYILYIAKRYLLLNTSYIKPKKYQVMAYWNIQRDATLPFEKGSLKLKMHGTAAY